ncbi:MAG TPA: tetrathionate reductase subunit TtrA [Desulfobacterales bacterium]|nr:tetrathionate reductase subunit TtrA [Desulfobacterales bacterium]
MDKTRRNIIKAAGLITSLGVFGLGYRFTLKGVAKGWWAGEKPPHKIYGNALEPEYSVDPKTGSIKANNNQYISNTVCMGCVSLCGVRLRVDKKTGKILRVAGNPYHTLAASLFLPYETPIKKSLVKLSRYNEDGLGHRATACGRGNAVLAKLYDPYRVMVPLKRVGPRNSGKFRPIDFEKLVEETVEGGNLFAGEDHVEGLRKIRDLKTPIDPSQPELGPKANQLAILAGFKEGRLPLMKRFGVNSFGSINFTGHRGNCGLSMRAGYAAFLGDWKKYPHTKPDFKNTKFLLNIGTAPANAGNPFQRQGKLVAQGRSDGDLRYVVVDPVLTNSDCMAASDRVKWIPIKPGTDSAFIMAITRWILENKKYNEGFLRVPSAKAAKNAKEPSWSNATHLVITADNHPLSGHFLRESHLSGQKGGKDDAFIVIDEQSGRPTSNEMSQSADIFYSGTVNIGGKEVLVKTSMQLLLESSQRYTLAEYSQFCGVPVKTIVETADQFTSYGRQAVVDFHGGTMHANGFYTAYGAAVLNSMIGNLNWKGGASKGGGRYPDFGKGPRYNFHKFPGKVKPKGVRISRSRFAYEKTTEFKIKKQQGKPYPAGAPWYPFSVAIQSEYIPSAMNRYPYGLKAMIMWNTNPLYGQAGLYSEVKKKLADPKNLPLIISIDPFINESTAFADYIVPDTVLYETWGSAWPWATHLTKTNSFRWPAAEPLQAKTKEGVPVCMESYLIAVAKRMGLPGFGERAIPDSTGGIHALHRPEDFFLRVFANVSFAGKPVPDIKDEELKITGVERLMPMLKKVLKSNEAPKVAYAMARGGRFESSEKAYQGNLLTYRYKKPVQIYNEKVALTRNSLTGERFSGVPIWHALTFADGSPLAKTYKASQWPFYLVCTKSQLQSSHTIGAQRLRQIHKVNAVIIHQQDADRLGLKRGDSVKLVTPGGTAEGKADIRGGIAPGVIGIEHGFGHWGLGARTTTIGGKTMPGEKARAAGIAHNLLGIADITRKDLSTLGDIVLGSNARQGIPARLEKI